MKPRFSALVTRLRWTEDRRPRTGKHVDTGFRQMTFKFEKLDVWQDSLDYLELIYQIASNLPDAERYNLRSQITRTATSVNLNIAEGSTGQTDAEQVRFLGMALRSLLETVACLHIIHRMDLVTDRTELRQAYRAAEVLTRRLVAMRRSLAPEGSWLKEPNATYQTQSDLATPFD